MSNVSILLRLEEMVANYLSNKVTKETFVTFLIDSINALEGFDYSVIQKARDFQYKFEVADFYDEDPQIETKEKVSTDFKNWIDTLK